jgi:hypothetical protein
MDAVFLYISFKQCLLKDIFRHHLLVHLFGTLYLYIYLGDQDQNNLTCIAEANIGYFVDPVQ